MKSGPRRLLLLACLSTGTLAAQTPPPLSVPEREYAPVEGFFKLPPGQNFVEPAGVAVNSKGHSAPGQGRHFDPHQIAVGRDGTIFTAEVLGWRAQKFPPRRHTTS